MQNAIVLENLISNAERRGLATGEFVVNMVSAELAEQMKNAQGPATDKTLPTILAVFAMADHAPPPHIERIRNAIIDGEVVLKPGETRDGLFIFHAFDPAVKSFQVDLGATLTRGEPFGFSAFYKKRKIKK